MKDRANPIIEKLVWIVATAGGIILIGAGIYGLSSLTDDLSTFVPTRGIVERVESKHVYRNRKRRTITQATIIYDTDRYGKLATTYDGILAFCMDKGDEVDIIYDPRKPRCMRLPTGDRIMYGAYCACGLLMAGAGIALSRLKQGKTKK